jgi:hypothetical protein
MDYNQQYWLSIIQAATNVGVIIAAIKVTMYLAEIKFKVNMMWQVFEQKFERRGDEFVSRPRENNVRYQKQHSSRDLGDR